MDVCRTLEQSSNSVFMSIRKLCLFVLTLCLSLRDLYRPEGKVQSGVQVFAGVSSPLTSVCVFLFQDLKVCV